jgi:GTP cyclohydrolase I
MTRTVHRAGAERAVCWPAAATVSRDLVPDGTDETRDTPVRAGAALRVIHESGPDIDLAAAEHAAGQFLAALGVEVDSECLRGTPGRMARAYAELFTSRPFNLTTFPNDEGYDELVLALAIPVRSVCEHHLLPFTGIAHVGYLPGQRILGLSKLARIVEHFARRPQLQERLTKQVADWLYTHLRPQGAGVVIVAEHTCMTLRGVQAAGSRTVTSTLLGTLREDPRSRQEFFALTGVGR